MAWIVRDEDMQSMLSFVHWLPDGDTKVHALIEYGKKGVMSQIHVYVPMHIPGYLSTAENGSMNDVCFANNDTVAL